MRKANRSFFSARELYPINSKRSYSDDGLDKTPKRKPVVGELD